MSGLMLDRKLLNSRRDFDVDAVARTLTLATLRRLDGVRKGEIVKFLAESHLIDLSFGDVFAARCPVHICLRELPGESGFAKVGLDGADLRGVVLSHAELFAVNFGGADLRHATFDDARLSSIELDNADLRGVSFRNSDISGTSFHGAKLDEAHFDHASLAPSPWNKDGPGWGRRTTLFLVDLESTCLTDTSFTAATLNYIDLREAGGLRTDFRAARIGSHVELATRR
jgi:uncharacterized protein YjbI with pentapeptide repeats